MPPHATLGRLLSRAREALSSAPNTPHPREAERLVRLATGRGMADLIARPELEVDQAAAARFERILARRLIGEPIQYIAGEWEFHGRPFTCDSRALIPRPETELLIDLLLEKAPSARSILDVGTGTGILAITAALELRHVEVIGIDVSIGAIALAARNARQLGVNVRLVASSWDSGIASSVRFDAILANPPYVDPADEESLAVEIRDFEPREALFSEGEPLAAIREVLAIAERRLSPGGWLFLEIGAGQAEGVSTELARSEELSVDEIRRDGAGIERAFSIQRRERQGERELLADPEAW